MVRYWVYQDSEFGPIPGARRIYLGKRGGVPETTVCRILVLTSSVRHSNYGSLPVLVEL